MSIRFFLISFLLVLSTGCSKKNPPAPAEAPAPVAETPERTELACLGAYETTDPEIAKQTLTFKEAGQCAFAHEGFPGTPYACSYEVKEPRKAKVTLLVTGSTEGWKFESHFAEDCAAVEPDGFGLKFSRKP